MKHLLVTFILYKVLIDKGVALEYRHGIKLKFKRQKKNSNTNGNKLEQKKWTNNQEIIEFD